MSLLKYNTTYKPFKYAWAMEIAESGVQQQYIVLVNGNRYRSISSFGKSINLND